MPMFRLPPAVRALVRTPLVSLVAILSLALGIGANAAIFSLFDQMLLRPLPVSNAGTGQPRRAGPKPGVAVVRRGRWLLNQVFTYPMFRDLERIQDGLHGHRCAPPSGANLAYRGQTLNGDGVLVSGSLFSSPRPQARAWPSVEPE